MWKPAICCIGYNRPASMQRLLGSIGKAIFDSEDITLIISIDESDKSNDVEQIANDFQWNHGKKLIRRFPERQGLKKHCLQCGDFSEEYGAIIFLEDDVVVAPGFYRYAVAALEAYGMDKRVFGISLYHENFMSTARFDFHAVHTGGDAYYLQNELSHGHCWIGTQWKNFRKWLIENGDKFPEYDCRIPKSVHGWKTETSWSKSLDNYLIQADLYYIAPYESFATNMSELGEHAKATTDICQTIMSDSLLNSYKFLPFEECAVYDMFFERKDKKIFDSIGMNSMETLMDLNGLRYDWTGFKYTFSIQKLPFRVIKSYGANLDPIENNIRYEIPGDAIRLYEIPEDYQSPKSLSEIPLHKKLFGRHEHLLNRYPGKLLLYIAFAKIKRRFF